MFSINPRNFTKILQLRKNPEYRIPEIENPELRLEIPKKKNQILEISKTAVLRKSLADTSKNGEI